MPRRLAPYLLFALLVCLFLWRPIFTGRALLPGDYLSQMLPWKASHDGPGFQIPDHRGAAQWNPMQSDAIAQFYPWRVFYARSMRAGHIPLWNPHQFCGTPFLANGQSAVLYPPNLAYLILEPITATNAYAALHLFLALAFMYLLLLELGRSKAAAILGAVTFAFSAFMVLWLELPTFVGAAVWLPLAMLLIHRSVERRSVFHGMLAGVAIAMSCLAGHFQIAFYVLLAALLWWLWKLFEVLRAEGQVYATLRVTAPFFGCMAVLALIAAPQVLPTVELAQNSHRVRDVTPEGYARFVANALAPYRLITAFVPGFYGDPSKNNYSLLGDFDGHMGSAADYMEYGMYCGILPLVLAFVGAASLRRVKYSGFFALLAVLALLTAMGTVVNVVFYYTVPGFSALGGPNRMLLLYCFGIAGLAAFGFDAGAGYVRRVLAGHVRQGVLVGLAIVLAVADLFAFGINYNPTCERSKVYPKTELTTRLKQIAGTNRIAPINSKWSLFQTPEAILPPNAAMVYGLYDVQGYDSLYTRDYKNRLDKIQGQDSSPIENGNMVLVKAAAPELKRLAGYILAAEKVKTAPGTGLAFVDEADGVNVYRVAGGEPTRPAARYEPFTFRLGLYLMLLGIAALGFVGTFRSVRFKHLKR